MFGRVTDNLRSDISRLLASEALAMAVHEDSQGLRRQETANSWDCGTGCRVFWERENGRAPCTTTAGLIIQGFWPCSYHCIVVL